MMLARTSRLLGDNALIGVTGLRLLVHVHMSNSSRFRTKFLMKLGDIVAMTMAISACQARLKFAYAELRLAALVYKCKSVWGIL